MWDKVLNKFSTVLMLAFQCLKQTIPRVSRVSSLKLRESVKATGLKRCSFSAAVTKCSDQVVYVRSRKYVRHVIAPTPVTVVSI